MKKLGLILIKFYQKNISPRKPKLCRYEPSCSEYTYQAIEKYGFFKGVDLGLKRISRCNPKGGEGYDPVP